jgi:hypothetical protein
MRKRIVVSLAVLVGMVGLTGVAPAQEEASQGMPAPPRPGPEQAVLKNDVGTWDASVEMFMMPGASPTTSAGVETNAMGCGGMCLVGKFEGEMMGQPFTGESITAYDSVKKKYVGLWMDSMSPGPSVSEATYDAASKAMSGTMEGPDMSGQVAKMVTRGQSKDQDHRVWSMYSVGPDGKESLGLRITYTRRK